MNDFSIVLVLVNTWLVISILRCDKVHLLLKLLIGVSFFGWNALPAVLMYIPHVFGSGYFTTDTYIKCSYYNEIYLFCAYFIAFALIKRKGYPRWTYKSDFQDSNAAFNILLYISIALTIYKVISVISNSSSYWDNNDITNIKALGPVDFLAGLGLSYLTGVVFLFRKKTSFGVYRLSVILIALYFVIHVLKGGRIYFFGIIILFIYYALSRHDTKSLVIAGVLGVFALGLLPVMSDLRGERQVLVKDIVAAASSSSSSTDMIMDEILTKTNSVLYGSYLIEKDGIGKWNGKMYSSTIYALVPRFLAPSKPEPGSVDGTVMGLPARASVAYYVTGEYDGIGNNGVPASLSSLWGGGWLAYIVEILASAYLIFLINCLFFSEKPVFVGFVFSLLSFPTGILEIPLPTVLISLQRDIVIYLFLAVFISLLIGGKKKQFVSR